MSHQPLRSRTINLDADEKPIPPSDRDQQSIFMVLPKEILSLIVSFMELEVKGRFSTTCRQYYHLLKSFLSTDLIQPSEFESSEISFKYLCPVQFKRNKRTYFIRSSIKDKKNPRTSIQSLFNLITTLKSRPHSLLPKLRFFLEDADKVYFVMDHTENYNLFQQIHPVKHFPEDTVRFLIAELVSQLCYLHAHNIQNSILYPDIVVLDAEGHVHIADFNLFLPHSQYVNPPTEYLSPEELRGDNDLAKTDWWQLGTLAYELSVGIPPFYSTNIGQIYEKILRSSPKFPPRLSPELVQFINKTLEKSPNQRISGEEIKAEPFFASIDWEKLENKEIQPPMKPAPIPKILNHWTDSFDNFTYDK